ncbi:MAG TPA: DMT family transporter [Actinomycetota bacterium]|nr:DMT family transporter [Actinomycetota bacterium]
MAILLGLAAALTYGAGDFVGGLVTRRAPLFTVVLLSQVAGTALLVAAVPFFVDSGPTASALAWGGASGAAGATGVLFLYKGLAAGRMSVVAPITSVEAAVVPVLWGLATGERPPLLALAGVVVALVAVVLVAGFEPGQVADDGAGGATDGARPRRLSPGVPEALVAGLAFGAFFILLDGAGDETGLWPLVGARAASLTVLTVLVLVRRERISAAPDTRPAIAAAGVLDVAANLLYLLATREGLLSIVAVLTSLYPASTILLARLVLGERMGRLQVAGLGLAAAGVVMMTVP